MNALLPAVDLRANIDQVYNQSSANACTAHAVVNALEAMFDHAGQSQRFSRAWIWWWSRVHAWRTGQDVGANYDNVRFALEEKGLVCDADYPWDGSPYTDPPAALQPAFKVERFIRVAPEVDAIKRKLCLGVPVTVNLRVHQGFFDMSAQANWRASHYDTTNAALGSHAVCIVGYDDAVERFLVENSYGPQWGDGGFFGLSYAELPTVREECWCVDYIPGFMPKPVEGYVSIPYMLNGSDFTNYYTANKERHRAAINGFLAAQDWQGLIDYAKDEGLTDKLLENLALQPRGTVRSAYEQTRDQLDWTGFAWADR